MSELQGLRKDIQRIVVALEKLAGIESQDFEKEQFLWLESEGEEIEVQESKGKGKQREERINRMKKEKIRGQKEENGIEGVEKVSFSPVVYSVSTRTL